MNKNPKCLKQTTIHKIIRLKTSVLQCHKQAKRGIALLVALGTMIVILIIASLAIYLISSGLRVAGGQKRYQSAFEASEGGIEIGIGIVDNAYSDHVLPASDSLDVGRFEVKIYPQYLFTSFGIGASIIFAHGYYGAGTALAAGGANLHYLVRAQSIGKGGERVPIEIEYKKTVGID